MLAAIGLLGAACASTDQDLSDVGAIPFDEVEPADVDWGDLDQVDQQLFTVLSQVNEIFRTQAADIWDSEYRFDQIPMGFAHTADGGEITAMYLLNSPDAASLPGTGVPLDASLGLGEVYSLESPNDLVAPDNREFFDFDADIGGTSTLLFFLPEDDIFLNPSTWAFARFVVHEAFHRHQLVDANWDQDDVDETPYPRDVENAALAQLEDEVVNAMVSATETDQVRRHLAQLVAIRETRSDMFGVGNRAAVQELLEGTARYVENRYAEVSGNDGGWAASTESSLQWVGFGRFYSSGAGMGWALDELGVAFKDEAAKGTPLIDLAREAVGDLDTTIVVEEAKAEFDFETLVSAAESADLEKAEDPLVVGADG
ncbi:MAG: hypothetical protein AAFO29_05595 [Actinomycetota bacterium]